MNHHGNDGKVSLNNKLNIIWMKILKIKCAFISKSVILVYFYVKTILKCCTFHWEDMNVVHCIWTPGGIHDMAASGHSTEGAGAAQGQRVPLWGYGRHRLGWRTGWQHPRSKQSHKMCFWAGWPLVFLCWLLLFYPPNWELTSLSNRVPRGW